MYMEQYLRLDDVHVAFLNCCTNEIHARWITLVQWLMHSHAHMMHCHANHDMLHPVQLRNCSMYTRHFRSLTPRPRPRSWNETALSEHFQGMVGTDTMKE